MLLCPTFPTRGVIFCALALLCATTCPARPVNSITPVESVPYVDARLYAGRWYEVARLPNRFQRKCVSDVTAEYFLNADGSFRVVNRCQTEKGHSKVSEGLASPARGNTSGARLEVNFLPQWLRWFPLGRGDYWVVMLDEHYRYAVVSEPSREFMWILSRKPALEPRVLDGILNRLQMAGYPIERLVRTPQNVGQSSENSDHRQPTVGPQSWVSD